MINSRKGTVKVLAGIAIIMIIAIQIIDSKAHPFFYHFLTWFTWPSVFFIAGYMLPVKKTVIQLLKQFTKWYLAPYFIAGILIIIFNKIIQLLDATTLFNAPFPAIRMGGKALLYGNGWPGETLIWKYEIGIGLIWVLLALFWGSLINALIAKLKSSTLQILLVILITVSGVYIARYIQLPWSFASAMVVQPFMLLGNYFNNDQKNWQPAIATVVAAIIIDLFISNADVFELTNVFMYHWILAMLTTIISLEAILTIAWFINKKCLKTATALIKIGQYWHISIAILGFIILIVPVNRYANAIISIHFITFILMWIITFMILFILQWLLSKGVSYWKQREG